MAATLKLVYRPKFQAYNQGGFPLAGGKVYAYDAGTTTPRITYKDSDLTVPNTWPVVLNAQGQADIWPGEGPFKIVVTDADDVQLYTQDNMRLDGDIISFVMGYTSIQVNGGAGGAGGYGGL